MFFTNNFANMYKRLFLSLDTVQYEGIYAHYDTFMGYLIYRKAPQYDNTFFSFTYFHVSNNVLFFTKYSGISFYIDLALTLYMIW